MRALAAGFIFKSTNPNLPLLPSSSHLPPPSCLGFRHSWEPCGRTAVPTACDMLASAALLPFLSPDSRSGHSGGWHLPTSLSSCLVSCLLLLLIFLHLKLLEFKLALADVQSGLLQAADNAFHTRGAPAGTPQLVLLLAPKPSTQTEGTSLSAEARLLLELLKMPLLVLTMRFPSPKSSTGAAQGSSSKAPNTLLSQIYLQRWPKSCLAENLRHLPAAQLSSCCPLHRHLTNYSEAPAAPSSTEGSQK